MRHRYLGPSVGALIVVIAAVAACSDGSEDLVDTGPGAQESRGTESAFEPAYRFEDINEFVATADQIASVEVVNVVRGRETDLEDELLVERVLEVRVVEGIKAIEDGAELSLADGLYASVRDRESGEFGQETLQLITEGVELEQGSVAIIGLVDGELLSMGVFPLQDGEVQDTERSGDLYVGVEAMTADELSQLLRERAALAPTTSTG